MMTEGKMKISVVVPIFNEQESVAELIARLTAVLPTISPDYEVILVDDGSRDGTVVELRRLAQLDRHLKVVELARNYGQTAAMAAGIDNSSGEIIITMDGDLQHDPSDIPRFVAKLEEGYDVVSGWRSVRTDSFIFRRLPSLCANYLMRVVSGVSIRDFASTFKAYRASLLKEIELFGELHRFIPVLAAKLGARMTEIPIETHPRKKGASKYGLMRAFGVFEDLVFLEFYSNYLTKPIRAFGRLFIFFFACGFGIAIFLMLLWSLGHVQRVLDHGALLLFSILLMVIGVQFLVGGILAELISRIYLKSTNSKIYRMKRN